jgi:hypothetical protein
MRRCWVGLDRWHALLCNVRSPIYFSMRIVLALLCNLPSYFWYVPKYVVEGRAMHAFKAASGEGTVGCTSTVWF